MYVACTGWMMCEIIFEFVRSCVSSSPFSSTLTFSPRTHAPSLPLNLSLFHINLYWELSHDVPSFDAQRQANPFYDWRSDRWANTSLSHLSMARQTGMSKCQCQCRSVKLCEYLRHIHSLLSCVVETIMSAETRVPSSADLREYVYFIYMTCHISAYEIEGCIT